MTRTRTNTARRSGFTLIEVMTAVALMTVGASGILMMQGATTRANQMAQETTIAVNFAQNWMERLKRDSLLWTDIGEVARTAVPGPAYLSASLSDASGEQWNLPVGSGSAWPAADAFGFDVDTSVPANLERIRYCVNFRNVVQHRALNSSLALDTDTLRVDVRVWWIRIGDARGALMPPGANPCETPPDPQEFRDGKARAVYVSNVLRWEAP